MKMRRIFSAAKLFSAVAIVALVPRVAMADEFDPLNVSEIGNYLLIGTGSGEVAVPVKVSNFEIGALKNTIPPESNKFLGPDMGSGHPVLPGNIAPIVLRIDFSGNVAATHPDGTVDLSNTGVYADPAIGIRCANDKIDNADLNSGGKKGCIITNSPSFFNDPNQFPNTFDDGPPADSVQVTANDAVGTTEINAANNFPGVTEDFDFEATGSGLLVDLFDATTGAKFIIPGLDAANFAPGTATNKTLDFGADAKLDASDDVFTFELMSGLNIVDLIATGKDLPHDFLMENMNFVVDGPADAIAIFRVPDTANFLCSHCNMVVGDGGIGLGNVIFASLNTTAGQGTFSIDNMIVNGIAFWDPQHGGWRDRLE